MHVDVGITWHRGARYHCRILSLVSAHILPFHPRRCIFSRSVPPRLPQTPPPAVVVQRSNSLALLLIRCWRFQLTGCPIRAPDACRPRNCRPRHEAATCSAAGNTHHSKIMRSEQLRAPYRIERSERRRCSRRCSRRRCHQCRSACLHSGVNAMAAAGTAAVAIAATSVVDVECLGSNNAQVRCRAGKAQSTHPMPTPRLMEHVGATFEPRPSQSSRRWHAARCTRINRRRTAESPPADHTATRRSSPEATQRVTAREALDVTVSRALCLAHPSASTRPARAPRK